MSRKELENKLREMISKQISVDIDNIDINSNLIHDLNFDSLDSVEMIMDMEDEFEIRISDEDAKNLINIKLIADFIERHKKR